MLVASYLFYMSWLPSYGLLLFFLTAANYFIGLAIEKYSAKKAFLLLSLVINLGCLAYFKYANFLCQSFFESAAITHGYFGLIKVPQIPPVLDILLPLGISFFAFEFIHYTVDVRSGSKAIKSPLDFALFAAFFPSQVSGPIKRYQQFDEQLHAAKKLHQQDMVEGLGMLMRGLFKKVALADNLAVITSLSVNKVFALGTVDAWVLMFAFLLQVYFDFSGYTDMGIGAARLLGFHLPNNFDLPYVASKNLIDFWQRWHITLSTWLRDYVQTPLTGFRSSRLRFNVATLLTMTVCGLWHGAAWHYVAWGFVHGVLLVLTREYLQIVKGSQMLKRLHGKKWMMPLACLGTFIAVHFTQSLFLAKSVDDAVVIMRNMIWYKPSTLGLAEMFWQSPVVVPLILYSLWGLAFVEIPWLPSKNFGFVRSFLTATPARQYALFSCVFVAAIAFCPSSPSPFIYFQF
ncbi:MAG: MBOAT family protein [Candidatus Melainabacteria bacterium]|nr:MBOAT family protein [Candidatus Melainabacteria bacterium]